MLARFGRPILVTGSHRSGTTWVGRMLASHPRVHYVKEPFNPSYQPECPVRHHWHLVTEEDERVFRAYLGRLFTFRHSWWDEVRARPHPRRLAGATLRALDAWRRKVFDSRPVMKDPIAFFSAEWLADAFDMNVVVLIRHPAAFASSLKQLGWTFPFGDLLCQPRLMGSYLVPFADDVARLHAAGADVIEQAVLVWRLVHRLVLEYQVRHPDWIFLRHEDLSLNPLVEFRHLFGHLGLSFPARVLRTIEEHSREADRGTPARPPSHELRRDSRANVWSWAHRLRREEVARVRKGTEDLAGYFYPEPSWWQSPARASA
jgi:hypothetical protein